MQELKQILRSRNPNSLPALIYAAATAVSNDSADCARTSSLSSVNALLEGRVQRLEAELESHDEEAKRSLQAMEQQFHRIKVELRLVLGFNTTNRRGSLTNRFQNDFKGLLLLSCSDNEVILKVKTSKTQDTLDMFLV